MFSQILMNVHLALMTVRALPPVEIQLVLTPVHVSQVTKEMVQTQEQGAQVRNKVIL